ncbi:quinon protein alcohol dehydrogenase-like superfamily [Thamnocephalis sphaerospora]|uniref:Quinon protein alcohol dehydrogenase-like superfamily n=1 Tax=Thamnocephalis sphaerospora TaxID=78915 RepID=A0A4P9XIA6_9FUNG|nr:quinon protein alcohol dehydrogenase-like superfamily [Thamnocephalis sphaerospora]|eukprot:RKP05412.1 quinon protein alcohol dehydrogenase-like superfamily [Thamnocephalis sphaerospora]
MATGRDRFTHTVDFPVYCMQFTGEGRLLVGGGGGGGQNGVKNKLALYDIDLSERALAEAAALTLNPNEDAPMCMSLHVESNVVACGVNASEEAIKEGKNNNCRIFELEEGEETCTITPGATAETESSNDTDNYLKTIRISKDGKHVVCGSSGGQLSIFKYPSMELAYPAKSCSKDIDDLDLDPDCDKVAAAEMVCDNELSVWSLSSGKQLETLDSPIINGKLKCRFRACCFGRGESIGSLFVAINSEDRKHALLCKLHAISYRKQQQESIGRSPVTSLCISNEGRWLAFATADLSVGIVCAQKLDVVRLFEQVHTFAITTLAFSPDSRLLASGSAAATCHIVQLPAQMKRRANKDPLWIILAMLCLIVYLVVLQPALLEGLTGVLSRLSPTASPLAAGPASADGTSAKDEL